MKLMRNIRVPSQKHVLRARHVPLVLHRLQILSAARAESGPLPDNMISDYIIFDNILLCIGFPDKN